MFIVESVLNIETFLGPAADEIADIKAGRAEEVVLFRNAFDLNPAGIETAFDSVAPALITYIAAPAVLRPCLIKQNVVRSVCIAKGRAQDKEPCLPKEVRVRRKIPVPVHHQIARCAAKDLIDAEQIPISISIRSEISEDDVDANLIVRGQIVNRLALEIGDVDHRRIVRVMKLVVETPHQISNETFARRQ